MNADFILTTKDTKHTEDRVLNTEFNRQDAKGADNRIRSKMTIKIFWRTLNPQLPGAPKQGESGSTFNLLLTTTQH
jgi:hypothetical protein